MDILKPWSANDPDELFQSILFLLITAVFAVKAQDLLTAFGKIGGKISKTEPISRVIEMKFLAVFWLLRISFWMSGPYFYFACASKVFNGSPASVSTISQISLMGYLSTPILGPLFGSFLSRRGPKISSMFAVVFYCIGALSLCSDSLPILLVGRALGGFGGTLMSNSPEAWLVDNVKVERNKDDHLRAIFGKAFQLDPVLAIFAGKIAEVFASHRGPTGPFQAQPFILSTALAMIIFLWSDSPTSQGGKENTPIQSKDGESLRSVLQTKVLNNRNIFLAGCVQILFESSMNIFVMLWPPTMDAAVKKAYGETTSTPYGSIFSCMMASCLLGGILFDHLVVSSALGFNTSMVLLTLCATISMCLVTYAVENVEADNLIPLTVAFLLFEACVGAYFPSIGVLRCSHYGDANLQLLLTLFQIPTNSIVAIIFVCLQVLGNTRALCLTCIFLGLAAISMLMLRRSDDLDKRKKEDAVKKIKAVILTKMSMQALSKAGDKRSKGPRARRRRSSLHEQGQDGLLNRASFSMPL